MANHISETRIFLAIAASNLFDAEYYLRQNPDVEQAMIDPIIHYVRYGEKEGRWPNPEFDLEIYRPVYDADTNILYQHIMKLAGREL